MHTGVTRLRTRAAKTMNGQTSKHRLTKAQTPQRKETNGRVRMDGRGFGGASVAPRGGARACPSWCVRSPARAPSRQRQSHKLDDAEVPGDREETSVRW